MLFGTEAFEIELLKGIQNIFNNSFFDTLMPAVTRFGDGGLIWIVCAVVLLCTKKYRRVGITLAAGLLMGLLIGNVVLKNLVMRPRPCWIMPEFPLLIGVPADYSFPSGHTTASFVSAFVLFKGSRKFGYVALVVASLIAFSRMYLFVHFPTDILGGILVAWVSYMIVNALIKRGYRDEAYTNAQKN